MLRDSVRELSDQTGLEDMINDAAYSGDDLEEECNDNNVVQHFSGIKGRQIEDERIPLGEAKFDGHDMIECPEGHQPYRQKFFQDNQRYWGRFEKETCGNCQLREQCFVVERNEFYSYGFYHDDRIVAERRHKMNDPKYKEFLQLRAGAESMINEAYHKTGKRTRFTGKIKVKNSNIAKAIAVSLNRVVNHQKKRKNGRPILKNSTLSKITM